MENKILMATLVQHLLRFISSHFFTINIFKASSLILLIVSIGCSQTTAPKIDEGNLISLSQTSPQFSSDGQKIVFEGLYDSIYAVHFIDLEGNYLGYILNQKGYLSSPTWAPGNNKIAISIEGNLYTVQISGDSLLKLTDNGEDFSCNWSPDGRYIAYTKSVCDPECGIAIFDLGNSTKKVIGKFGGYASWNKNSDKIYYYHTLYTKTSNTDKTEYQGFVFKRVDINTLKTDSLFFIAKANLHFWLEDCTVSPNEQNISFSASYGSPPVINIWTIDLERKQVTQITSDGGNCPSYSPTGDKIVFTNTNIREGGLWIMNSDGSNKRKLTKLRR